MVAILTCDLRLTAVHSAPHVRSARKYTPVLRSPG